MPTIGARAAIDLAIPTGLDGAKILAWQIKSGITAQEAIARAAAAIGAVNTQISNTWGGLVYFTQMMYSIGRQGDGSRTMTPTKVEFKKADPIRADIIGSMLPLGDYEDALAWTPMYMRDALTQQLDADTTLIGERWMSRVEFDILTRLFTNTENAIGSSGYDVPFAIGTGMNVNYIPPAYGSYTFDSTHTHFQVTNGAVNGTTLTTAMENAIKELRHHGITGRLAALVSETDLATWTGITGKIAKFVPPGVNTVAGNSGAPVYVTQAELQGIPGELFGFYLSDRGVVELRYHTRIPTGYFYVTKSYGVNNAKNGLAIREHPTRGFGLVPDPQVSLSINPELDKVLFKATHGVGINDRLNGVVNYVANGASTWVNPSF